MSISAAIVRFNDVISRLRPGLPALIVLLATFVGGQGNVADAASQALVHREPNGDLRVIVRRQPAANSETAAQTGSASPLSKKGNEKNLVTGCTLWSNEPSTNECLNVNSPELVGYGKPPKNAEGRGKEKTPTGIFRYLEYYELGEEELPLGGQIIEATDNEYITTATKKKAGIPVGLYAMIRPWNEGATWEEAGNGSPWWSPGGDFTGTSAVIDQGVGTTKGWVSWNIAAMMQEWTNREVIVPGRADYGFVLADAESPLSVENVISIDNKPKQEGYIEYLEEPDTTPPSTPQRLDATLNSETGETTVSWEGSTDPPFPDGYHGSGVAAYNYRYKAGSGEWTSWTSTQSTAFIVPGTTSGEQISVELDAVDNAKNVSPVTAVALTTTGPTLTPENPGGTLPKEEGPVDMVPEPEDAESFAMAPLIRNSAIPSSGPANATPDTTYSEKPCPKIEACGTFNAAAAAAYAERWSLQGPGRIENGSERVQAEYEQHDRSFDFFGGGEGGDCTNFASAALHAGGVKYMRSHGDSNPDGDAEYTQKADTEEFLKGEGSWWSYWYDYPYDGGPYIVRSYEVTESFVRSGKLFQHLTEYGLARVVHNGEYVRPGDLVFYDLEGSSLEPSKLDHTQIVVKTSHSTVIVAQHSRGYEHSLGYVIQKVDGEKGPEHQRWNFIILEPNHTAANIPLDS